MAEYTQNYNLKKPAEDDFYNVKDFNDNMDKIDAELKKAQDHRENTSNPHQTTAEQVGAIPSSEKGVANGVATLDDDGNLEQMPTADDVEAIPKARNLIMVDDDNVTLTAEQSGSVVEIAGDGNVILPVEVEGECYEYIIMNNTTEERTIMTKPKGKNLLNPQAGTITANGVTCTINEDGTITLNGTSTAHFGFRFYPTLTEGFKSEDDDIFLLLNSNKSYTLSVSVLSGSVSSTDFGFEVDSGLNVLATISSGEQTFNSANYNVSSFGFWTMPSITFSDYTVKIQLEQSETATEWEQFVSPSTIDLDGGTGTNSITLDGGQIVKICTDGWNWFLSSNSRPALSKDTTSIASAITRSTSDPSTVGANGTLWAVTT